MSQHTLDEVSSTNDEPDALVVVTPRPGPGPVHPVASGRATHVVSLAESHSTAVIAPKTSLREPGSSASMRSTASMVRS